MFGAAVLMLLDNIEHHNEKQTQNVKRDLQRGRLDHDFLLRRPLHRRSRLRHGRRASPCSPQQLLVGDRRRFRIYGLRHPLGLGGPLGDRRQHPVRRDDDPADQGDGADLRRPSTCSRCGGRSSLGACLGGNGTLIGASANLTVAGIAERNGIEFSFLTYTKYAFGLMLLSVAICHAYLWLRYL